MALARFYAFDCRYCGDRGFVRSRMQQQGANSLTSVTRPCPKCTPEPTPQGVPWSRQNDTFEAWNPAKNPGMERARLRCEQVATGQAWCAVLTGDFGTGKTHLAVAALLRFGRGQFWKVPELLDQIRQRAYGDNGVGALEAMQPVKAEAGVLVLDDMGTENATDWAAEVLYRILDYRYEAKLPTIITSNVTFGKLDGRLVSRYGEGLVICSGRDVRLT